MYVCDGGGGGACVVGQVCTLIVLNLKLQFMVPKLHNSIHFTHAYTCNAHTHTYSHTLTHTYTYTPTQLHTNTHMHIHTPIPRYSSTNLHKQARAQTHTGTLNPWKRDRVLHLKRKPASPDPLLERMIKVAL